MDTPRQSTTIDNNAAPSRRSTAADRRKEQTPAGKRAVQKHPAGLRSILSIDTLFPGSRNRSVAAPSISTKSSEDSLKSRSSTSSKGKERSVDIHSISAPTPMQSPRRQQPEFARAPMPRQPFMQKATPARPEESITTASRASSEEPSRPLSTRAITHVTQVGPYGQRGQVVPMSPKALSKLYTDVVQRKPINIPERRSSKLVVANEAQKIQSRRASIQSGSAIASRRQSLHNKRRSRPLSSRRSLPIDSDSEASEEEAESLSMFSGGNETSVIVGEAEIANICIPGRPTSFYRTKRQTANLMAMRRKSRLAYMESARQTFNDSGVDCGTSVSSHSSPSPIDNPSSGQSLGRLHSSSSRATSISSPSLRSTPSKGLLVAEKVVDTDTVDRRSRHLMAVTSEEAVILASLRAKRATAQNLLDISEVSQERSFVTEPSISPLLRTSTLKLSTNGQYPCASPSSPGTAISPSAQHNSPCPYHLSPDLSFTSMRLGFSDSASASPLTSTPSDAAPGEHTSHTPAGADVLQGLGVRLSPSIGLMRSSSVNKSWRQSTGMTRAVREACWRMDGEHANESAVAWV